MTTELFCDLACVCIISYVYFRVVFGLDIGLNNRRLVYPKVATLKFSS
ncbi:hypothetical protein [Pseudanabaena sp. PCC 6802]|nr:hypothetical protein [Pseudanabaena sp. PCC 6802]